MAVLAVLLFFPTAAAEEKPSLDDQLREHLHNDYFNLNLLIQSEGRFSFKDNDFQGGRTFSAANARISLRGELDGGFFYRVMVDAAPQVRLLDAFVGYKMHDAISVSVGAMKPRQTLDFIPDPGAHNFVDRAVITGLLVGTREIGVAATGDVGGLYYYAGLFNGSRLNDNTNNKFYGIGRLQYTFSDLIPGTIQIGVNTSHGDSEDVTSGSSGPLLAGKRTIYGADLEVISEPFYFATEYLQGDLETSVMGNNADETINGYYFTGGYSLSPKKMAFVRWQSWGYDKANWQKNQLTLGTNIDITGLLGIVLNLDAYIPDQGDTLYGASFIVQVQF